MTDSLRTRLLAWYAGMVTIVIAVVAVAVCWVTWRSRLDAIDAELGARAAIVAAAVRPGGDGRFDVELPSESTAYFQRRQGTPYYAVWRGDGALVDRSDPDIASSRAPARGTWTRGRYREVVIHAQGLTVLTGRNISDVWREIWALAGTMTVVGLVGMAAALAGAWLVIGRALAPVQRINETARRMAEGDLTARIAVDGTGTELGQVAYALNLAFDRLRESIERQRRLTADASHQLRTPVATMIAELDWALLRKRSGDEYRESLETCRRAGARMQVLIEGLLTLARAEGGDRPLRRGAVHVDEIVEQAAAMLRPVAGRRGVTLDVSIDRAADPLAAIGDPDRLHDLVSSLLYNGILYNRPEGTVCATVAAEAGEVVLRVRDTGIGIGPDELPRVFDRFYRSPAARACEPAGAGLGLALARWIAEAHGGSIACSSEVGRGTELVVRLPAAHAVATGAGRLSARLPRPPSTPSASTAALAAGLQTDASPSAASSE
jgi:two-component system, OmpR family, sensor kinase